jgi:REP element-mobilizing transposase RayT
VAWLRHIKSTSIEGIELPGIIWQRDYFEHIIRDAAELEQKRQYIRANPARWQEQHKL